MRDLFLSHHVKEMTAETNENIYDKVNDQEYKSKGSTNKDQGRDSKATSFLATDVWDEIS